MRVVLALVAFLTATSGWAADPKQVSWSDLGGRLSGADNPFYNLSADEARLLGVLIEIDQAIASGETLSKQQKNGEAIALSALESVGIDGRAKIRAAAQFDERLSQSMVTLNEELLGQEIEIAGYALPLEFDGMKVTELLLVPYAGACIHTPPPPSNQIVHIKSPDGFVMRSLFDPVVVRGGLSSSGEDMEVNLSDGEADFKVGYQMIAGSIVLYR